jgi:hypothetical protein
VAGQGDRRLGAGWLGAARAGLGGVVGGRLGGQGIQTDRGGGVVGGELMDLGGAGQIPAGEPGHSELLERM